MDMILQFPEQLNVPKDFDITVSEILCFRNHFLKTSLFSVLF